MGEMLHSVSGEHMLIVLCIGAINGVVLSWHTRKMPVGQYILHFLLSAGVAFPLVCLFFEGPIAASVAAYIYFCMGAAISNLLVGCAVDGVSFVRELFNS